MIAGVTAALFYGISSNGMKKYLSEVSALTKTAGSLFFAALFMLALLPFFLPSFEVITSVQWGYAIILGVVCTAFAYFIFFRLIKNIGPARSVSVTFLIPVFSFLFGYLLLGETVTTRMRGAIIIILFGMTLVLKIISAKTHN